MSFIEKFRCSTHWAATECTSFNFNWQTYTEINDHHFLKWCTLFIVQEPLTKHMERKLSEIIIKKNNIRQHTQATTVSDDDDENGPKTDTNLTQMIQCLKWMTESLLCCCCCCFFFVALVCGVSLLDTDLVCLHSILTLLILLRFVKICDDVYNLFFSPWAYSSLFGDLLTNNLAFRSRERQSEGILL